MIEIEYEAEEELELPYSEIIRENRDRIPGLREMPL